MICGICERLPELTIFHSCIWQTYSSLLFIFIHRFSLANFVWCSHTALQLAIKKAEYPISNGRFKFPLLSRNSNKLSVEWENRNSVLLVRLWNQRITIESTPISILWTRSWLKLRNDQDFLCALGDVTLSDSSASDSFDPVAGYYNFEKELFQAGQCLFSRFKKTHVEQSIKTAVEVIDVLHANSPLWNYTRGLEGGVHFGRHSRNIMLSEKFLQRIQAVEDLPW